MSKVFCNRCKYYKDLWDWGMAPQCVSPDNVVKCDTYFRSSAKTTYLLALAEKNAHNNCLSYEPKWWVKLFCRK